MKELQHFLYVYLGIAIVFLCAFTMLFLWYLFFNDINILIEIITWEKTKMVLGIYVFGSFIIGLLSAD